MMLYNTNEDTQMIDYNQLSQMCVLLNQMLLRGMEIVLDIHVDWILMQ